MCERAARLAPDRLDYQWRLYDLYLNNSQADKALATLKRLAERLPRDQQVQDWYRFYREAYAFKPGEFSPAVSAPPTAERPPPPGPPPLSGQPPAAPRPAGPLGRPRSHIARASHRPP